MADLKISQLTAITTLTPATDVLPVVDVNGITKKITTNQILGSGGTATLASATITGDLTVRTTGFSVSSSGVGIGSATPTSGTLSLVSRFLLFGDSQTKLGDSGLVNGAAADGNTQLQYFGGKSLFFNEGVATRMTLNSTGLGVGVASPAQKVDVNGALLATNVYLRSDDSDVSWGAGAGSRPIIRGNQTNNTLKFYTASTDRMTIDSAGNVGVGVTPSYKLDVAGAVRIGGGANPSMRLETGTNTGFIDYNNTRLALHAGSLPIDFVAGNTVKMTLDASGNLLVGTPSTGGSISNATKTVGGIFSTLIGNTASIATATPTTMFAAPSESTLMVTAYITGSAAPLNYNAVSIVKVSSGTAAITAISTALNLTITLSGANVQVTQTSGVNQTIQFNVLRLA